MAFGWERWGGGVQLGEMGRRRSSWGGLQVAGSLGNPWEIREESGKKLCIFVFIIFF